MFCKCADIIHSCQVKRGIEYLWWQDREIFTLSYWRHGRLWRHYLVHNPRTGVQTGYVRWWYGNRGQELHDIEDEMWLAAWEAA
jgi:hypothetical protein